MIEPQGILEAALYVSDIDRAEAFYQRVFSLTSAGKDSERHVFFHCGDSILLLFRAEATRNPSSEAPAHGAEGQGHLAFRMEHEEIERWRGHLRDCGVEIEKEMTWPSGGYSIYFRDPDGNSLELATRAVWPER